jgi:predicted lipid-binding transport protein (Tim44 family)
MSNEEGSKQEEESTNRGIAVRRPEHAPSVPFWKRHRGELLSRAGWLPLIGGLLAGVVILFLPSLFTGLHLGEGVIIILGLLALLLGLALQLVALSIELDVRTQTAIQDLDDSAQKALDRAGEQADLWRKLEQAPLMSKPMKGIINAAARIDAKGDEIFVARATEMLEEWRDSIKEMAEGQIRIVPAQFSSLVMPLVKKAIDEMGEDSTIRAVSVWTTSSTPPRPGGRHPQVSTIGKLTRRL